MIYPMPTCVFNWRILPKWLAAIVQNVQNYENCAKCAKLCHKELVVTGAGCHKSWLSQELVVTRAGCHRSWLSEAGCYKSWLSLCPLIHIGRAALYNTVTVVLITEALKLLVN